ncbi:hypothetical protein HYY75_04490 [bacterium]|nr:hypothetical protein [bacterium]
MLKVICFVVFGIVISTTGFTMIQTLPFPELVTNSDVIVIAKVTDITPAAKNDEKTFELRNILSIERILKGEWPADKPLEFITQDFQGKWREDEVAFPEKGERTILFLKRDDKGTLQLVNGIQSIWPLEKGSDKPLRMGFRYSLEQLEKEIQKPKGR